MEVTLKIRLSYIKASLQRNVASYIPRYDTWQKSSYISFFFSNLGVTVAYGVYPRNSGHKSGIYPGWNASLSLGTKSTHVHT